MADIEKAMKGLECCLEGGCKDCPYPCICEYSDDWPKELHRDALELLKEQKRRIETLESLRRIEQEGR